MGIAWMHWHIASVIGVLIFVGAIVGLNVWHAISPGYARKGFLPMTTTRGERAFLSILSFMFINILWLAFVPKVHILWSLPISAVVIFIMVKWG